MGDDVTGFRKERIEKLLHELRYECERGMLQGEIDETVLFQFIVPLSKRIPDGIVLCEFRTRPMPRYAVPMGSSEPRLRLVPIHPANTDSKER